MNFPQLRLRTEFSFQQTFGTVNHVVETVAELGAKSAAIVDVNTWGHVKFAKACDKAGIQPIFGCEIPVARDGMKNRPVSWVLAEDTRKFYNLTTKFAENGWLEPEDFAEAKGVIRIAGNGLFDPSQFDYIDLNPHSVWALRSSIELHKRTGKPLIITSDNRIARKDDITYFGATEGRAQTTPMHILSRNELIDHLSKFVPMELLLQAEKNSYELEERLQGIKLQKAPLIRFDGDLVALARAGQEYRLGRGHIEAWTDEYEARFVREIEQIQMKAFDSYFLMVADLVSYAKTKMLVGPARGSSAGSLVCFLLGITEVDPLVHNLLFERFIDVSRSDLPDIDIDFSDTKRHMAFEYLEEKYGSAHYSRLGNVGLLKPSSVLAQVTKKFNVPISETFGVKTAIIEYSSGDARYGRALEDTMTTTETGRSFAIKRPDCARVMAALENHAWYTGVHAAAAIVCNEPISDFCTVKEGIAQLDKSDAEYLELLKIDVLGLRTLGVLEDAGVFTNEQFYDLKPNDPAAFKVLNDGLFGCVFQFEGATQRMATAHVQVNSFTQIDHLTALARPGPMSGGASQLYFARANGTAKVEFRTPQMEKFLSDTLGVVLYQEQVMAIVKELGQFSWADTSAIRKAMSGRKGEEYFRQKGELFVQGATAQGIEASVALQIWEEICTFGSWGMNRSHTVSYAMISYWCLYMKAHHKLEYAAASLRTAKDEEQAVETLRELVAEGIDYTPFDPELSDVNWSVQDGKLYGGFLNLKGVGRVKGAALIKKREEGKLTEKDHEFLRAAEVAYKDLCEAHTLWKAYYDNPEAMGVRAGTAVINMADAQENVESVFIGKLVKKVIGFENEPIRIKKRGGKRWPEGKEDRFLDLHFVDDSLSKAIMCRIRPEKWAEMGQFIADRAPAGAWFLVRARKLQGITMFVIRKIIWLDVDKYVEVNHVEEA